MATLDIVSLNETKAALRLNDSTYDGLLTAWITAVSLRLDDLCRPIVVRTLTDELHDGGDRWIAPVYTPISSVTSLAEYDTAGTATTLTAEDYDTKPADAYLLDGRTIRRRASGADAYFASGRRNVRLTYVAGRYATTATVSEQFKRAALICLAHMWRAEQGTGNPTYGLEGGELVSFGPGWAIPRRAADLLGAELDPKVTIA